MDRWDLPGIAALSRIEDPYADRDRLRLPTDVANAAGDRSFTPDSSRFDPDARTGPKYLRYVPNGGPSPRGTDAGASVPTFDRAIVEGKPLPKFKWTMGKDGSVAVEVETKPRAVNLWQATNPKARDFRRMTIGTAGQSSPLTPDGKGAYVAGGCRSRRRGGRRSSSSQCSTAGTLQGEREGQPWLCA